jgi:hypothetical protein
MTKEEKVSAGGRRFSVQRKMAVVARLLRGEPLEMVARETNVTIQKLTEWRDRALAQTVRVRNYSPWLYRRVMTQRISAQVV